MRDFWSYKITAKTPNIVLAAVLPVFSLVFLEFYTHVPWDLSVPVFLLNLAFYYLLAGICTFLSGSASLGYGIAPVFPMLFGLVNYIVVDFRSSPIVPWDIYSIRTAASVAGNYKFEPTQNLVMVLLGFLLLMFVGSRMGLRIQNRRVRAAGLLLFLLLMFGYVRSVGTDAVIEAAGLDTTLFTPNVLYRNNGLTVGFLGNLKFLAVEEPEGYSPELAKETSAGYPGETGEASDLPNVVVIMNEAFSDLSVFGDLETDYDYMPFIHSLTENTVKGNCYVSVKGGNTANTEYEFLTGDSMAFLPAGSVPYQQYIKGEMPSMASYLDGLGYQTVALHPFNASGWARDKVYPWLGFEQTLFKSEFSSPLLIRDYVSDNSAFTKIIELFEEKPEDGRMFAFEVTMQNHGGYSKYVGDFDESVHLLGTDSDSTQARSANIYLSLMLESDRAFEMLVNYFQKQDEDTIVLMFGDHQPSDYITNVILRLLGLDRESSDDVYFDNYIVPFVMWANFDIEEETVDAISANYLGELLFEKAGIPLTGYQEFLAELRKKIPALTANMLLTDGERRHYGADDADVEEPLRSYHILSYNHLADAGHRLEGFFD